MAVTLLVSQPGIRLGVKIFIRNGRKPENDRYRRRRELAGGRASSQAPNSQGC